jgi:hypothetical protein
MMEQWPVIPHAFVTNTLRYVMPITALVVTACYPRLPLFDELAVPQAPAAGLLLPAVQKVREAAARLS